MRNLTTVLMMSAVLAMGMAMTACSSDSGGSSSDGGDSTTSTGGSDATGSTTEATTDTGGGTTTTDGGGTTADGTTTGATTGGDTCTPFCQPSWECGPDGCGGTCGAGCPETDVCNNAKHVCEEKAVVVPLAEFGEACGETAECQRTIDSPEGQVANPQWQACSNAQCESGNCQPPACSKSCTVTKDQTDSEGNPGPDGIDDPDAAFNDCAGAADGIMGSAHTCVALLPPDQGQPLNWCLPGTTFKECSNNTECPGDETCQLLYVVGQYTSRCAAQPKGSVKIGQHCNENPVEGDVLYCETTLCFGLGCTGFCQSDTDCLTDTCSGGTCAASGAACANDAECSSFYCRNEYHLFGEDDPNLGELTFDMCWPKQCGTNVDCSGDYHCSISGNGKEGAEVEWEHLCLPDAPGSASLGEECEDDATDNIPKPECAGVCLNNGTCSAICNGDADCAAGGNTMLCSASAVPVDFEDDGIDDKHLALGLCVDFAGSQTPCIKDGDCGADEVCDFYSFFADETQTSMDGGGICSTFDAGEGDVGEACGGNSGVNCKSGFCLGSSGDQPGYCTALCDTMSDCPQGTSLGNFQGIYNMACRGLVYSQGFTEGSNEDILWLPLCIPVVEETSSLTVCTGDGTCAGASEACQPFAIASGATGPGKIEMLCVGAGAFDAQGTFVPATAAYGAACDITFESENAADACMSNLCFQDTSADAGYCGKLCDADADCSSAGSEYTCQNVVLIDRANDADDVATGMCRKAASCITCFDDNDCSGDYVCANAGGVGLLADQRCAPACTVDADCAGTDGGNTCAVSIGANGQPDGTSACIPTCN